MCYCCRRRCRGGNSCLSGGWWLLLLVVVSAAVTFLNETDWRHQSLMESLLLRFMIEKTHDRIWKHWLLTVGPAPVFLTTYLENIYLTMPLASLAFLPLPSGIAQGETS